VTEAGFLEEATPDVEGPVLSADARRDAERLMARYPDPRSAMVPLLYLVQAEVGWVPRQGMREVAELLDMKTAEVEAVASFYTMLKLHPCGRFVLSICTNPSCALLGGKALLEHAESSLGPMPGHVTADGLFTVEEEECLAACDRAPVMAVNYLYYDRVGFGAFDAIVAGVKAGDIPPADRGGAPGDLREVSRTLAGLGATPAGAGEGPHGG
jgi:NADH-quinone oxidoreductase subunit E